MLHPSSHAPLVGVVSVVVLVCGCGARTSDGGEAAEVGVAIGRIAESDAVVAVVRDAGGVVAYVCGGATTFDRWTRWYHGGASDAALSADGWTFEIHASDMAGRVVDPDGAPHAWSAASATDGAGLYTTVDAGCRTGVVVDADLGAQGVWCDGGGRYAQVTPVTPIDVQSFEVRVALPEGARDLVVERAPGAAALSR